MKIWIDILTPKQLLFSEPIIEKLGKKHDILCTSRAYGEVSKLAKIRSFNIIFVGKHGGESRESKLSASIERIQKLQKKVKAFSPDLVLSFCSPEAARISYGLGIKHFAFCDSPHAEAVMKLTIPLIQKLLIPHVIPKEEFSKYGIEKKNIISYKAIDAAVTIKRKNKEIVKLPFKKINSKNILIRIEEEQAAYTSKSSKIIPIIKKIIEEFGEENIVVLGRYENQINNLKKQFGNKIRILKMSFDGKDLLSKTDVFIGSGGTMTAEAALLGVPTISYNAVPNIIEKYLVKTHLINRENDPVKVCHEIKRVLSKSNSAHKKKVRKIVSNMEDPIQKLSNLIRQ